MHYNFIEIVTSFFDTLIETCPSDSVGISIEPIKKYLDKLPNKTNVKKINVSVSNINGEAYIYFIPEEIIRQIKLPDWMIGCCSINKIHPSLNGEIDWVNNAIKPILEPLDIDIKDLVVKQKVDVINFATLIKNETITSIDYLKIDTEGHDVIILNDYLDNCEKDNNLYANKIQFETNELTTIADRAQVLDRMFSLGYKIIQQSYETTLIRHEQ